MMNDIEEEIRKKLKLFRATSNQIIFVFGSIPSYSFYCIISWVRRDSDGRFVFGSLGCDKQT